MGKARKPMQRLAVAAFALLLAVACGPPAAQAADGWSPAGDLPVGRMFHTAELLQDGRVLAAGGRLPMVSVTPTTALYDPAANTWSAAASMSTQRWLHQQTALLNGKLLVTGGSTNGSSTLGVTGAELYDPSTNTWTAAASMHQARSQFAATRLGNGKVLVSGGNGATQTSEVYDPATDTWSAPVSMQFEHSYHSSTLLPSGKVLVAGGAGAGAYATPNAELYDPATDAWTAVASMATPRGFQTATVLPGGDVLVAGGHGASTPVTATAELYHPSSETWSPAATMSKARSAQTATLLTSGDVLVTGGTGHFPISPTAELYRTRQRHVDPRGADGAAPLRPHGNASWRREGPRRRRRRPELRDAQLAALRPAPGDRHERDGDRCRGRTAHRRRHDHGPVATAPQRHGDVPPLCPGRCEAAARLRSTSRPAGR